jgi:hypothetical protein
MLLKTQSLTPVSSLLCKIDNADQRPLAPSQSTDFSQCSHATNLFRRNIRVLSLIYFANSAMLTRSPQLPAMRSVVCELRIV